MKVALKHKITIIIFSFSLWGLSLSAQILATFEDDHRDKLTMSDEWFDSTIFVILGV